MTLIPPLPISRQPASAAAAAAIVLGYGVLLSAVLFAGWSSPAAAQARPRSDAPRSAEAARAHASSYEVLGKRYRVRASSDGYRESGIASWYGRPFHGRPTSSGERYDMNEMTAAHTTLPLPTWVEVTNLSNGKRVIVKVNDRGPFVADRVIDLSYAAASALDIVRSGIARVEIRAVAEPRAATASEPVSVAPAPAPTSTLSLAPLFAETGKFTTRTDAVAVVAGLKSQGLFNAFVVTEDGRRKSVHRVRVGPLIDESEVKRMSDRLRALGAKRSRSIVMQ